MDHFGIHLYVTFSMVAFVISFHGDYVGWQSTGGGRVFAAGSGEDWLCWRALNRLHTEVGRAKTVTRRWGYLDDAQSADCDCGERQTIAHLLSCRLLYETYTAGDLATVRDRAKACARKWEKIVRTTRQKKKLHPHISPCWHGPPLVPQTTRTVAEMRLSVLHANTESAGVHDGNSPPRPCLALCLIE